MREGVSTSAEARSLLGEPWQVHTNGAGEQMFVWHFVRSDATSGLVSMSVETNTQQAALVFGSDGRLLRVHNLINVPAPMPATPIKPVKWNPAPTRGTEQAAAQAREQQLQELQNTPGLSYEEYKRRYDMIMGQ
ncbi:TPA: hypothetical protein L5S40_002636 [Pseudomonas aeruginosa]|nr:hypothetical protein [Pseudomonas aeruginosa]HBP1202100.1 hypothetical protein [Pseudomonas aeruginosa]